MTFITTREEALKELESFIEKNIFNYSTQRSFDFGPHNRKNVSCLSPYITHRLITELEVTKIVLAKRPYQKVEKFIQEIFWRIYWKGWLELRPKVWSDFLEDVKSLKEDENYINAINAKTNIDCFNDWVQELKDYNYLHNHTRMLFASIWIFTLGLPWQKGAEFFMKYLLDGDAASNTLSWRWVAGIQTKGKNYIAQNWNISKFTNNKYKNTNLKENPKPIIDQREYKILPIEFKNNEKKFENLIVFDNETNPNFLTLEKYKKIYYILLTLDERELKLSDQVLKYKKPQCLELK